MRRKCTSCGKESDGLLVLGEGRLPYCLPCARAVEEIANNNYQFIVYGTDTPSDERTFCLDELTA